MLHKKAFVLPMLRPVRVLALLTVAMLGSGCAEMAKVKTEVGQAIDDFKAKPGSPVTQARPQPQAAPSRSVPFRPIRPVAQTDALFARRTVNGRELLTELMAVRGAASGGNFDDSLAGLMGRSNPSVRVGNRSKRAADLESQFRATFRQVFDKSTDQIAYRAVDDFFARLSSNGDVLARQTIELPDAKGLSRQQKQQVLVMASMVLGFKASNALVADSKKEFEELLTLYGQMIEQRQSAARLLLQALLVRDQAERTTAEANARELRRALSQEDLEFLQSFSQSTDVKTFAADLTAQNLALQYLRRQDPAAFSDYHAKSTRYVSRYSAYLKATLGAGAFAAFGGNFYRKAEGMVERSGTQGAILALPFAGDFVSELGELGGNLQPAGRDIGSIFQRLFGSGGFNIDIDGRRTVSGVSVVGALDQLATQSELEIFRRNMIRSDGSGYLNRLYACDASLVGDYFDRVVPREVRRDFAENYFGVKPETEFSFRNAFDGTIKSRNRMTMVRDLLREEPSAKEPASSTGKAVADVQRYVTDAAREMSRAEFMRLIYAGSAEAPHQARLDLGRTGVAIAADDESVFVYESYIQGCMKQYVS